MTDNDNPLIAEPTEHVPGVLEGEILVGKYRVDRVLGTGGMGVVVAARHLQLDTRVAIKFLRPCFLENEEVVARFAREARSVFRINSEHVARIFDVGTLDTGVPYMVMEYLEGTDLATLLMEKGPLPIEQAIDFVLQACDAVADAHALGIVHRDLKPSNLFWVARSDGRRIIKVLDFGISKLTSPLMAPEDRLTHASALMGTPLYMSPEQLEAPDTVDSRTDIWALGIVLYELLTGQMPFMGRTLPQVTVKIAVRQPLPLRELRADAPEALAQVINVCLAKERANRYQTVAELIAALLAFAPNRTRPALAGGPETVRAGAVLVLDAEGTPQSLVPSTQTLAPERRTSGARPGSPRRNWALAGIGILFLTGLALSKFGTQRAQTGSLAAAQPSASPKSVNVELASARAEPIEAQTLAAAPTVPTSPAPKKSGATAAPASAPLSMSRYVAANSRYVVAKAPVPKTAQGVTQSAASAASDGNCDPSFALDAQGRKHFKLECLKASPDSSSKASVAQSGCNPSFVLDDQGRKRFKPECFLTTSP